MSDNPWQNLTRPAASDVINARRVDALLPFNFFWARALDGSCLLVLQHGAASTPKSKLPKLKGIDVAIVHGDASDPMLVLQLLDPEHRDIFYRLCIDVIDAAASAKSEAEAVQKTLARTWRWHHLLRGGKDACLSVEEQKGLIGELMVLKSLLLPVMPANDAITAWRGPLGSPKDFEVGNVCIEAKARRGAAMPYVTISSEHQLDLAAVDALFLFVVDLSQAPSEHDDAANITEIARSVRMQIELSDPSAIEPFESLLLAAGFRWEDDYAAYRWIEGSSDLFLVEETFPRLSAADMPSGIARVKYSLALQECEPFRANAQDLYDALEADSVH